MAFTSSRPDTFGDRPIIGKTTSGGKVFGSTKRELERRSKVSIPTPDVRRNNKSSSNSGDMIISAVRRKNKDTDETDTTLQSSVRRGRLNLQGFGSGGYSTPSSSKTTNSTLAGVAGLPKPDNLAEAFRIGYESKFQGNSNYFTNMLMRGVTAGFEALGAGESEAQKIFEDFGQSISDDLVGKDGKSGLLGFYQNPDNISNIISAFMNSVGATSEQSRFNVAFNNSMVQQFSGVAPRTFSFEWKLYASNEAESIAIFELIDFFKEFMHPELVDPYLNIIEFPGTFERVDVRSPNGMVIFPIFECVLQDMSVNYTGSGNPYFFTSGMPVSISLSITLQEIRSLTRNDFSKGSSSSSTPGGSGRGDGKSEASRRSSDPSSPSFNAPR